MAARTAKAKKVKTTKSTKAPAKAERAAKPKARKAYFAKKELKEFKTLLHKKKEEILHRMETFESRTRHGNPFETHGDMIDVASGEIEGGLQFRLQDKNRKLLGEIEHAILKFEHGTYGICEGSDEYITKERLRIRPWTRYSIEYKEFVDEQKKRKQMSGK